MPSSKAYPGLDRSPRQNWIDRLPAALKVQWHSTTIYRAAKHMHYERGMPIGVAIPSAVNWCKHIVRTGDVKQWPGPQQVRPDKVADAVRSLGIWNAMKAYARAH